ncbi:trans-sulfuration enzyme family protein [Puniceicoccus vermicola]|uniref:PLP-dependent transferase n=1 Tax=Puniceicoccus vermicola TaxID=388746 RepID=A0A7X1B286_9BACT|nr:PLP-dependent aspartate aminotransferase family protein [Puniceicoccus vermicola]MBC2604291.1 PLP-dependent transferase [Puniceicoccus vermicola]
MSDRKQHLDTRAVHAGVYNDDTHGSITTPIYPSSTFSFPTPGEPPHFNYGRVDHPTREALQQNLASLEGGHRAWACVSGMAAIQAVLFLLKSGDHVVCGRDAYAGTLRLFLRVLRRFEIQFSLVEMENEEAVRAAVRPETKMIWIETPTNPMMRVVDIAVMTAFARERGLISVVDNTFLTPVFQRPFELGADIIIHSTTKYLNGHSDVMGGAVICRDETYADEIEYIIASVGLGQGPFDTWLVLRGVKTLGARMKAHQENAIKIAEFLSEREEIRSVNFPGLPDFPQKEVVERQQSGPGGMLSFELETEKVDPIRFVKAVRIFQLAVSLGGVESLIELPFSMSHSSMEEEEKYSAGLKPELVRLSPGIEATEDLIEDLDQALRAAAL